MKQDKTSAAIAKLEKEVRRLRRGLVALATLLVGVGSVAFVAPSSVHEVVTAKRFVVLDDAGVTRAVLGLHEEPVQQHVSLEDEQFSLKSTAEYLSLRMFFGKDRTLTLGRGRSLSDPSLHMVDHRYDWESESSISSEGLEITYADDESDLRVRMNYYGISGSLRDNSKEERLDRAFALENDADEPTQLLLTEDEEKKAYGWQ